MAATKSPYMKMFGLRGFLILFAVLMAIIPAAVMLPAVARLSGSVTEQSAAETVRATAHSVAARLSQALYNEWHKHERLVGLIQSIQGNVDSAVLRSRLDGLRALNEQYVWIGMAGPDGRVQVASGGLLEGQSVASRPWFTAGLEGEFAGDVHEAVLLQRLVAPDAREPLRLVDFAVPIRKNGGGAAGVLGSHLSWDWVRSLVRGVPLSENVEVMLVSKGGQILVGPAGVEGTSPNLPSIMAARQSVAAQRVETWPDGRTYLTTVIPEVSYLNLPSFGWSIVARQPQEVAFTAARTMTSGLLTSLVLTGAAILGFGVLVTFFLHTPLRRVVAGAEALGQGRFDAAIPDEQRYREVAALSGSLAEIHSRLTQQGEQAEASPPRLSVVSGRS
jgi:HAMP domain-containing protein